MKISIIRTFLSDLLQLSVSYLIISFSKKGTVIYHLGNKMFNIQILEHFLNMYTAWFPNLSFVFQNFKYHFNNMKVITKIFKKCRGFRLNNIISKSFIWNINIYVKVIYPYSRTAYNITKKSWHIYQYFYE